MTRRKSQSSPPYSTIDQKLLIDIHVGLSHNAFIPIFSISLVWPILSDLKTWRLGMDKRFNSALFFRRLGFVFQNKYGDSKYLQFQFQKI